MLDLLTPLKNSSLKEQFVQRFEELILSGKLTIGQKLPSERELAKKLGVSRPVVHEGMVELASRGLVTLKPRVGTIINDFRTQGSISLLISLLNYHKGELDPKLLQSILQLRMFMEIEFARLAAINRTKEQLEILQKINKEEFLTRETDYEKITELDFEYHLHIAIATDNMVYPLLMNSFKPVYTNLSGLFFKHTSEARKVHQFHRELNVAIEKKNATAAKAIMKSMLTHGEFHLRKYINTGKDVPAKRRNEK
ncbi:MAG: FadR family transcriptional regulator [Spirochaetes bacterium]|nr:FadR family transcriptional regulator [Spirochaetota bacterium]